MNHLQTLKKSTPQQQNIYYYSLRIDELALEDTINRLTNQLNYSESSSRSYVHSQFLLEMIENLQSELAAVRNQQRGG